MEGSDEPLPSVMKAVRVHKFGGPGVLQLDTNIPLPTCGAKQVLIKVFAAGVNPWETFAREGAFSSISADKLPFTPGSDCAGVIARVGADVSRLKVSDRVYSVQTVSGSYAEYCLARECHTFRLHQDLTFSQGAALGVPYFTAYCALFLRAQCKRGDTVLVHGASGGVGIACCQIALAHGMRVLATAGTERGLQMLHQNHITSTFNHRKKGYVRQIQEAAGERGVDVVCEMVASKNLKNDVDLLARKGRVVVIGSRGRTQISPHSLSSKEATIHDIAVLTSSEEEYAQMAAALDAGAAAGWLQPVISEEFPLSSAAEAQREVIEHKQGSCGKIILSIR